MDQVAQIIAQAIGLPSEIGPVRRVLVEPTIDSEGDGALSVTLVIETGGVGGREAIDLYYDVQQALITAGDLRFPIIGFATEDDLAEDGGSES